MPESDLYRALFDAMDESVIIVDTDTYAIVDVNNKALEEFGYSLDEMLQLSIADLVENYPMIERQKIQSKSYLRCKKRDSSSFSAEVIVSLIEYNNKVLIVFNIKNLTDVFQRNRMNEALELSEEWHRSIINDQIEMICRLSCDGTITFANRTCCEYFNKEYADLIGTSFTDLIECTDKDLAEKSFKKISKNSPFIYYDCKIIKNCGDERWIRWFIRATFDENSDNVIEYELIGRDITDHKKLELEIEKSENRCLSILNNLQDGFYQTNSEGNIVFISRSALDILGYIDDSEVLGTPARNYFVTPSDRDRLLSRLISAGGRLHDVEVELLNKDGKKILASLNFQLIYNEDGSIAGTQGTFRDITEFKRKTNEVIRWYHIVEGLKNALILMETDGTIIYANKAFLDIAHSPDYITIEKDILGKKIKNIILFDLPDTFESVWNTVDKTGKWFGPAYIFCVHGDSGRIPIDVMFSKIQNGDGKCFIVASAYDVSEYKKLEEKVKEQSRLYEELSASMEKLVEQMNFVNKKSYEKISNLEEEFKKTTSRFLMNYGERGEAVFDNERVIFQP